MRLCCKSALKSLLSHLKIIAMPSVPIALNIIEIQIETFAKLQPHFKEKGDNIIKKQKYHDENISSLYYWFRFRFWIQHTFQDIPSSHARPAASDVGSSGPCVGRWHIGLLPFDFVEQHGSFVIRTYLQIQCNLVLIYPQTSEIFSIYDMSQWQTMGRVSLMKPFNQHNEPCHEDLRSTPAKGQADVVDLGPAFKQPRVGFSCASWPEPIRGRHEAHPGQYRQQTGGWPSITYSQQTQEGEPMLV